MVNDLKISIFYPTSLVKGSVELGPNKCISSDEGKVISTESKELYIKRT